MHFNAFNAITEYVDCVYKWLLNWHYNFSVSERQKTDKKKTVVFTV